MDRNIKLLLNSMFAIKGEYNVGYCMDEVSDYIIVQCLLHGVFETPLFQYRLCENDYGFIIQQFDKDSHDNPYKEWFDVAELWKVNCSR